MKSPFSPSTLSTSVYVRISIFGCRPTSTSLGESIHMEQSLVGKVLSSWAMCPPMLGPFFDQIDLKTGRGQVQRGLDSADAAANDHYVSKVAARVIGLTLSFNDFCFHCRASPSEF